MSVRWAKLYKGTAAELALEDAVASLGVPYRTQFPYYLYGLRFFPDFLLPTLGVIIEVDDPSHNKADKIIADAERTEALEAEGWRVVRCTNEEALSDPHGTVRALIRGLGFSVPLTPQAFRGKIAACLPRPKKAAQKQRREAIAATRRARRQPRPGTPPRTPASPPTSSSSDS